ncbi:MAG: hypothetical protein P4L51_09855 [Puia sp.]|nr:hypothetical protein [Puia sp.]
MSNVQSPPPVNGALVAVLLIANVLVVRVSFTDSAKWYFALFITLPLFIIALYLNRKNKT